MGKIEILLPKMGESVAEATVTQILVSAGDSVEADDPIVEIATDKVDSEVPAPESGKIIEILCNEGDVIAVGKPIAIIEVEGAADSPGSTAPAPEKKTEEVNKPEPVAAKIEEEIQEVSSNLKSNTGDSNKFYSPLVRSIAKEENISFEELDAIAGSGAQGRVTKEDILSYVDQRKNGSTPKVAPKPESAPKAQPSAAVPAATKSAEIPQPAVSVGGSDSIEEMGRMRKLIADHMVMSKQVSPHVTSYVEADVTNIVEWRNKIKGA
ncbi:MAG: biotin/lipoyl-containing protein, partial [Luteibaculum sp.]